MKKIKIAYIGGGSKLWAHIFMTDLALAENIGGEICLYDIDVESAQINRKFGQRVNEHPNAVTKWNYTVVDNIEAALNKADFVVISILPATFKEMAVDVHAPEEYGVYQSVGDTVGPGGVLRAMRTVPIYEDFAKKIKDICPDAWVINLTNPMTICTKTLFDVFPDVKAFGCCHEVFHAQDFLACVAAETLNIKQPHRTEIKTEIAGINHFTWITQATYKDKDVIKMLPAFIKKHYETGYCSYTGKAPMAHLDGDPFVGGNKLKMDCFNRFKALPAAEDRHLAEFMNNNWYLANPDAARYWTFGLTTVNYRILQRQERINQTIKIANGELPLDLKKSDEEVVDLIKAILGLGDIQSNVNLINRGQMPSLPMGAVVETNCRFSYDSVEPILAPALPLPAHNLVLRNSNNISTCYNGIKYRDLDVLFESFINQPLCSTLTLKQAKKLFAKMLDGTKEYLTAYPDLERYIRSLQNA